jgi:hypothetical protein
MDGAGGFGLAVVVERPPLHVNINMGEADIRRPRNIVKWPGLKPAAIFNSTARQVLEASDGPAQA